MSIEITERAAREVKNVMEEQGMSLKEFMLRVGVSGGGCKGFEYSLTFAKIEEFNEEIDTLSEVDELKIAIDTKSDLYLDGTIIDFYTDINRRGFVFNNPQSKGCCGCGNSFSV